MAIGRMWKSDPGSTHPTNAVSFLPFFFYFTTFLLSFPVFTSPHLSLAFSLPLFIFAPFLTDCHSLLPLLNLISLTLLPECLFFSLSFFPLLLPCLPVSLFSPASHTLSPSSCCCTLNSRVRSSVQNEALGFSLLFHFPS